MLTIEWAMGEHFNYSCTHFTLYFLMLYCYEEYVLLATLKRISLNCEPSSWGKMPLIAITGKGLVRAVEKRSITKSRSMLNVPVRMICNSPCHLCFAVVLCLGFSLWVLWTVPSFAQKGPLIFGYCVQASLSAACFLASHSYSVLYEYVYCCILKPSFKLLLWSFTSPFKEHVAMWSRSFKYVSCAMMNFHSRSHLVTVAELITGWS